MIRFFRQALQRARDRFGRRRVNTVAVLVMIGIASVAVRLLLNYQFHKSALLYIGVPYLVSVMIAAFRPEASDRKWWHQYRDDTFMALIVLLGSSIVLFEGFICVLFFLPIYFLIETALILAGWARERAKRRSGSALVSMVPLLVVVMSLEGTTPALTVDRDAHVTVSKVADLTPDQVLGHLAEPFDLRKKRHWLLAIFPMPYEIQAGSLAAGDVHVVKTRYHRWFVTNTHEGEMHLQLVEVDDHRVKTRFIHDTSFFSSYLTPVGTEITLDEIAPGRTQITLRIDYERSLDPAWYFHPLQQFGVGKMAEFLIDEVMIRDE